jgi:hypothetical protein
MGRWKTEGYKQNVMLDIATLVKLKLNRHIVQLFIFVPSLSGICVSYKNVVWKFKLGDKFSFDCLESQKDGPKFGWKLVRSISQT